MEELCRRIGMPEEVTEILLQLHRNPNFQPDLEPLLPPMSNILAFQRSFHILPLEKPCTGVIQWVFRNPKLSPADYPENTTLQRRLKAFLQEGNLFHDAKGILYQDPFLPYSTK